VDRVSIERMCAGKEFQTGSTLFTYRYVARRIEPRPQERAHKFSEGWTCGFGDMLADRPTDTLIAILRSPNEME